MPTADDGVDLDLDSRPGGERCRVCVYTSDAIHTIAAVSEPFALPVKHCVTTILGLEPGFTMPQGAVPGRLGVWLEERRPKLDALFWSSSLAGALGRRSRWRERPASRKPSRHPGRWRGRACPPAAV
jgi:hypothetical protein